MDKDISFLKVKYEINPDLKIGTLIKFKIQLDDLNKESFTFYGVISEVKNDYIKVLLIKDNHNFALYDNDYLEISAKEIDERKYRVKIINIEYTTIDFESESNF